TIVALDLIALMMILRVPQLLLSAGSQIGRVWKSAGRPSRRKAKPPSAPAAARRSPSHPRRLGARSRLAQAARRLGARGGLAQARRRLGLRRELTQRRISARGALAPAAGARLSAQLIPGGIAGVIIGLLAYLISAHL